MNVPTHLVVNSPPTNQGSVLGRVIADSIGLGQLLPLIWRVVVLGAALDELRADIERERAKKVTLSEEQISIDVELRRLNRDRAFSPWSDGKNEPLTEIPTDKLQTIEGTNWFQTMLTVQVGVRDASSCDQKDSYTKRSIVRIISARENLDKGNWTRKNGTPSNFSSASTHTKTRRFVPLPHREWTGRRRESFTSIFGSLADEPLPRTISAPLSQEEYAARHKNDESVTVSHLPNFCATCSMWVTKLHDHAQCFADNKHEVSSVVPACKSEMLRDERFYSWLLEREILTSGGKDATDPQVKKIDKILREKYRYRVR